MSSPTTSVKPAQTAAVATLVGTGHLRRRGALMPRCCWNRTRLVGQGYGRSPAYAHAIGPVGR